MQNIIRQLAAEIRIQEHQVKVAVELLDSGATVPFIARYRKEVTGALDDVQLRELEYRLGYLRELQDRRATVIKAGLSNTARSARTLRSTSMEAFFRPFMKRL